MLQLADALMSGVHGWPRDPNRACNCYRAAAYGCSEEEELQVQGHALAAGSPEAMVPSANVVLCYINTRLMGRDILENVDFSHILLQALSAERTLEQLLFWLASSVRRGWVSPMAIQMARSIQDVNFLNHHQVNDTTKGYIQTLLKVWRYREMEIEFERQQ